MAIMNLRDLPHTCAWIWSFIQTNDGKQKGLYWFKNHGALLYSNLNIFVFLMGQDARTNALCKPR
jgi:hypothetical protein